MASIGNRAGYGGNAKDLDAKIKESFNISQTNQKASFKFQEPARRMGKRPQHRLYKPSTASADWSSLNLKTDDFIAPVQHHRSNIRSMMPQPTQSHMQQQPNYLIAVNQESHMGPVSRTQLTNSYQQQGQNYQTNMSTQYTNFDSSGTVMPQTNYGSQSSNYITGAHNYLASTNGTRSPSQPTNAVGNKVNSYQLPSWMTNPNQIPIIYKEVLKLCAMSNSYADTSKLYPIFVSSHLPQDVLGHIWSAANKSTPGQLTYSEVYIALALIALAQKGEMNLSVDYVTKLKSAPIPTLQFMQSRVNNAFAAPVVSSNPVFVSNNDPADDDFADFQSVPPVPMSASSSSSSLQSTSANVNDENFQDFQSFVPNVPISNSNSTSMFPSSFSENLSNQISQNTNKPDPKSSNLLSEAFTKPIILTNTNVSSSKPLSAKSNIIFPITSTTNEGGSSLSRIFDNKGSMQAANTNTVTDLFGKVESKAKDNHTNKLAMPVQPGSVLRNSDFSSTVFSKSTANLEAQTNNSGADKYSALRDLVSLSSADNNTSEKQESEYDLMGSSIPPGPSIFPVENAEKHEKKVTSVMDEEIMFDDFQSFPVSTTPVSLSTTQDDFQSFSVPVSLPSAQNNFQNFPVQVPSSLSGNHETKPTDDGLYSLDEPISPLSQRKQANVNVISPKPLSSPKPKRFVIPKGISEADSDDFGEFSSGPPPIDDHADLEGDSYQIGDSSLVGFDAFDDFEEAQTTKKNKAKEKSSKPDGTAFSDLLRGPSSKELETTLKIDAKEKDERGETYFSSFSDMNNDNLSVEQVVEDNTTVDGTSTNNTDNIVTEVVWSEPTNGITSTVLNEIDHQSIIQQQNETVMEENTNDIIEKHDTDITSQTDSTSVAENTSVAVQSTDKPKWDREYDDLRALKEGSKGIKPMEIYVEHWGRCLAICKDIIASTSDIFAALNSPSVCHEIVNSGRGKEFISCTSEVYGVARRIRKGMESIGLQNEELEMTLKDIEISWNNLLGFCPYTPSVHKTPEHCCTPAGKDMVEGRDIESSACGLCLLSTNGERPIGLECGGKIYHAPCANLWLNQVTPILPRLQVPNEL